MKRDAIEGMITKLKESPEAGNFLELFFAVVAEEELRRMELTLPVPYNDSPASIKLVFIEGFKHAEKLMKEGK